MAEPEAGPELDALVAARVMGWHRSSRAREHADELWWNSLGEGGSITPLRPFSTDIAAAWEVLDYLLSVGFRGVNVVLAKEAGGMDCSCWLFSANPISRARAPTAPLAICRAALAAVEKSDG